MNSDQKPFDRETTCKSVIFLKGIGRRCEFCNKHIFGRIDKKTCGNKCRSKMQREKKGNVQTNLLGLHAFVSLKTTGNKKQYRIMKLYLKKGVIEEVKITPESKELWSLLEKIEQFRDISKPLEIIA